MATTLLAMRPNNNFDASQKLLTKATPAPKKTTESEDSVPRQSSTKVSHGFSTAIIEGDWDQTMVKDRETDQTVSKENALDALATLATSTMPSPISDNDFEAMPPPPPRRSRAFSNPEGMEKWDSYRQSDRCHFVLPSTILEEEMASANIACEAHEEEMRRFESCSFRPTTKAGPPKKRGLTIFRLSTCEQEESKEEVEENEDLGTSPTTVISPSSAEEDVNKSETSNLKSPVTTDNTTGNDDDNLGPNELLRRARSRLLEDLATETTAEKNGLPLPHALDKYKSIYNKNGRIGIYTPLERAAIIAKFNTKRGRRVWNKKIRYNCRKNLADRRMRVKGRFVKRAVEQKEVNKPVDNEEMTMTADSESCSLSSGPSSPTPLFSKKTDAVIIEQTTSADLEDISMPDVNDPDAGFEPTESQPFRRLRRHTIT